MIKSADDIKGLLRPQGRGRVHQRAQDISASTRVRRRQSGCLRHIPFTPAIWAASRCTIEYKDMNTTSPRPSRHLLDNYKDLFDLELATTRLIRACQLEDGRRCHFRIRARHVRSIRTVSWAYTQIKVTKVADDDLACCRITWRSRAGRIAVTAACMTQPGVNKNASDKDKQATSTSSSGMVTDDEPRRSSPRIRASPYRSPHRWR